MIEELALLVPVAGIVAACTALCVSRASYYRAQKPKLEPKPRPRPPRALGDEERARVLALLDSKPYMDLAPAQVYAKLLETASTFAQRGQCIACSPMPTKSASVARSGGIPST